MNAQVSVTAPNQGYDGLTLEIRNDGIAILSVDVPGETQNVLKTELIEQANSIFDQLEQDVGIKGVVFISGKPGSFIAGADINMLKSCETAAAATALARIGQTFCERIERFRIPVVAAINGPCLGGGLELALACHGRICTDNDKTVLGLPEVMLGLLPGSGGTQRLPRLIGITGALDMMLTGRHLKPSRAKRIGLVDEVVPATILLQAAIEMLPRLEKGRNTGRPISLFSAQGMMKAALEDNPLGRRVLFGKAREQVMAKTIGNYPAPLRIIDCVAAGYSKGLHAGYETEARYFGELGATSEARELINIYFASTELKKDNGIGDTAISPLKVKHVGVLGAGLMGAGITYVTVDKAHTPVRLKDKDSQAIGRGMRYINKLIQPRLRRRSITPFEAGLINHRVTATLDFSGFAKLDLVIEAVFEDLELKHRMLSDVQAHCPESVIFASNTSSIPIARIAETARRPERVIGMHYFSPVEKMPLLEVITTEKTAPEVIATAVDFGRKQGKTVIVVKDGAGFYVNRILAPYINEANHLLEAGIAIDNIDSTLTRFGFPVGPFTLLDEVGIDVVAKVAPILHQAFGERMKPSGLADTLLADNRYGKKSSKGFYLYPAAGNSKRRVDASVYELLGIKAQLPMDEQEIIERCVLQMINEAARCWQEGVIRNLRDGDIGAVFGIGFPPFRGGPFGYADSLGANTIVTKLQHYQKRFGERFAPADILLQMSAGNETFYPR